LFVALWLAIGAGMLTLLVAAVGKQKQNTCKDYTITIKGNSEDRYFLSKSEIVKVLKGATNGNMKGQSKKAFNLRLMEDLLEKNVWIKDAQLYFDNNDVLHVSIRERQPIARIFTTGGRSFFMDDDQQFMQLSDRRNARVPVFTGFPDKKIRTPQDSVLLHDVKAAAEFINSNAFWTAQVAQIDLSASEADGTWEFQMVPVVGNHIVKLGNGENIQQKFNRLFTFYRQVLSRTGFDKYKTIDVRFAGQVIGAKSENPKVDSVQLRKNVEGMLQQIKKMEMEAEAMEKAMADSLAIPAEDVRKSNAAH
jgi:cell division protein FtsQ